MTKVSEAPLYIDDSANLSMTEIRAKARRLKQRQGLRLIIIDYLQLMSSDVRRRIGELGDVESSGVVEVVSDGFEGDWSSPCTAGGLAPGEGRKTTLKNV